MANLDAQTIARLSKLAQIDLPEQEMVSLTNDLSGILDFIDVLSQANTDNTEPLLSTLELTQNTINERDDAVTEPNQRDALQAIAPEVTNGLYLVPELNKIYNTYTTE